MKNLSAYRVRPVALLLFLVSSYVASYAVGPSITSLSPNVGPLGSSVTINGSGFGNNQSNSTVKFNGTAATPSSWSSTRIVAPVPTGATTGNVIVTVSGKASNGVNFTVSPGISSLSPNSAAIGFPITITGTLFGASQGASTVKFNGVTAAPTSWSNTQIQVPVPAGTTSGNVVVTVGGTGSNGVSFTVVTGGYLAGRIETPPFSYPPDYPTINLSDPEILDWVHWASGSSCDRKNGGTLISGLTVIGPDAPVEYDGRVDHFSWNNGQCSLWTDASRFTYLPNVGDAFQFSVAADTTPKTLKLYLGDWGANGTVKASLSDNSAIPYSDSSILSAYVVSGTYIIDFRASAPGQTLTVTYSVAGTFPGGGVILLEAAAVTPKHPDVAITQPSAGQSLTAPASFTSSVQASEVAGTINSVSLFQDGNMLATLPNAPFNFQVSNLAAGNYSFTAQATDANGRSQTSQPVPVHIVGTGGELVPSVGMTPSSVDLTTQGTADWTMYGRQDFDDVRSIALDRKANVPPLIGTASRINSAPWLTYGDGLITYSAEDGTESFASGTFGIFSTNPNAGFQIEIDAGLTERTANIYVGAWQAQGKLEAYLSDGSAPAYADTTTDTLDHINHVYTLTYHAASAGQKLIVRYTLLANHAYGNITLQAVTLSAPARGALWGVISNATNGSSIAGAQVKVSQWNTTKATTTSDVNGRFAVGNLLAGAYDVMVSASGFGTASSTGVVVLPFEDTAFNVGLTAPGAISGKVTQADGITGISGAVVQALVGVSTAASATSDANGNFTISDLNAGSYQTRASASGYSPALQSASVTANSTTTLNFALQGPGSTSGTVSYVYDALGRLVGVISPSGDSATYNYDAVGNLLSIQRQNVTQLSIMTFTPGQASVGTTVTISGTGFSSTPAQNSVKFNGVAAVVQSASSTQLLVTVPSGATTGPISITTASGTVTSSSSFAVTNP